MSIRLTLARGAIRIGARFYERAPAEKVRAGIMPFPPTEVASTYGAREESIAGVRCVWLRPESRNRGVIVHLHGGGYWSGPAKGHWQWLAELCNRTGMAAVAPEYALAPEHAFPIAIEQTVSVIESVLDSRDAGSVDAPVFVAGDSAGGGLAVGAALCMRDAAKRLPDALLLLSPWLDASMTRPDTRSFERRDAMLSIKGLERGSLPYIGSADPKHPYISPLYGDPAGLPPMLVQVGTHEMFLPECQAWAARCAASGVACALTVQRGGFHGYGLFFTLPEGRAAIQQQAAFLSQAARRIG